MTFPPSALNFCSSSSGSEWPEIRFMNLAKTGKGWIGNFNSSYIIQLLGSILHRHSKINKQMMQ